MGPGLRRRVTAAALGVVAALVLGMVGAPSAQAADPITTKYNALGGSQSFLGAPTTSNYATPGGGQARNYQGGSIYWSSSTGAWSVRGLIHDQYRTLGGPGGPVGYPTTDETTTPDGVGRFNHFAGSGGASILNRPGSDGDPHDGIPTGGWSVRWAA